jgi:hypothetical protein
MKYFIISMYVMWLLLTISLALKETKNENNSDHK